MIKAPCKSSFYFLTDEYLANALFKRQMTVFVNNPTNLYSEEYKRGKMGSGRCMQQAEQQRFCQNNPFGRLNSGRVGGQAGGGGVIPVRGIYGITSEGQHCPHVFHCLQVLSIHEAQV